MRKSTNQIADWYEFVLNDDGDFATNPWGFSGEAEENDGAISHNNADWVVSTQGVYTLRFSQREDGSAVDAFVFQKSDLPAPTGYGPAMSSLEQSRLSFLAVISEDATAEQFSELTLAPSPDAPSNNDVWSSENEEGIDWSKIYRGAPVGSFEVSSTNEHSLIKFTCPGLLQTIRDDTDGVLSIVLYRTINNQNQDSFASKEHSTYPAPIIDVDFWYPSVGSVITIR